MTMPTRFILKVAAAVVISTGLAHAAPYDRQDRAWRIQRGERLEWNVLDDFRAYPAEGKGAVHSWAACMQMAFALAGYYPGQDELLGSTFRNHAEATRFNVASMPREVHINARGQDVYFSLNTLPGRLSAGDTIRSIDHAGPVILVINPAQGRKRGGDPLLERKQNAVRLVLLHAYHWEIERSGVRTLWVDVYDPQPPDGSPGDSVSVPYNELAKAWAYTLRGNLVSLQTRLGVSGPG